MSDDQVHLATLLPPPYTVVRGADLNPPFRATGAVISGRTLVVATVDHRSGGAFRFDPTCSFEAKMQGDSQFHVLDFANEVHGWMNHFRIDHIAIRMMGPTARKCVPSPFAFKIETIIQMIPSIFVNAVHPNRVNAWVKKAKTILPLDSLDQLKAAEATLWKRAIEAACFAIEHDDDDRIVTEDCFE